MSCVFVIEVSSLGEKNQNFTDIIPAMIHKYQKFYLKKM